MSLDAKQCPYRIYRLTVLWDLANVLCHASWHATFPVPIASSWQRVLPSNFLPDRHVAKAMKRSLAAFRELSRHTQQHLQPSSFCKFTKNANKSKVKQLKEMFFGEYAIQSYRLATYSWVTMQCLWLAVEHISDSKSMPVMTVTIFIDFPNSTFMKGPIWTCRNPRD